MNVILKMGNVKGVPWLLMMAKIVLYPFLIVCGWNAIVILKLMVDYGKKMQDKILKLLMLERSLALEYIGVGFKEGLFSLSA